MLKIRILLHVLIFSFAASNSACAAGNCTFSEETISKKEYSDNHSIAVSKWFPKSNEVKGVLSNGNLFSVKYWSCDHYGRQAIMVIGPQMQTIPDELNDHVLHLGKIALSESELVLLNNSIETRPLKLTELPTILRIVSKEFDEFYVKINIVDESIFIEIKLYKA